MQKQSVVLRFPKTLLARVDDYKEKKGFGTRTQTIFHLIQVALEQSENRDSLSYPFSEGDSSPTYSLDLALRMP